MCVFLSGSRSVLGLLVLGLLTWCASSIEITNFVSHNVLGDGEIETRVYYNRTAAKETTTATNSTLVAKFRQVTNGRHFIQLIYSNGNITDCEYSRDVEKSRAFLKDFKKHLKELVSSQNITVESLDDKPLPPSIQSWFNMKALRSECRKVHRRLKNAANKMRKRNIAHKSQKNRKHKEYYHKQFLEGSSSKDKNEFLLSKNNKHDIWFGKNGEKMSTAEIIEDADGNKRFLSSENEDHTQRHLYTVEEKDEKLNHTKNHHIKHNHHHESEKGKFGQNKFVDVDKPKKQGKKQKGQSNHDDKHQHKNSGRRRPSHDNDKEIVVHHSKKNNTEEKHFANRWTKIHHPNLNYTSNSEKGTKLTNFFITPSTLWCGPNDKAGVYARLGGFSRADSCCRRHDQCLLAIPGNTRRFSFYNSSPFTISHCDCDDSAPDVTDVLRIPGTKWCGKGYSATNYTNVAGFSRTDMCCRIHDLACPFYIPGFATRWGLFNWRVNTIMHCSCDERFRACLKLADSSDANFVGRLFFNVVQTKCFVIKPRKVCTKRSWWGNGCEQYGYVKEAVLRDNIPY